MVVEVGDRIAFYGMIGIIAGVVGTMFNSWMIYLARDTVKKLEKNTNHIQEELNRVIRSDALQEGEQKGKAQAQADRDATTDKQAGGPNR